MITTIILAALAVLFVLVILVIIIMVKLYSDKTEDISPQMLDLKNELNELKTKQLENQQAFPNEPDDERNGAEP